MGVPVLRKRVYPGLRVFEKRVPYERSGLGTGNCRLLWPPKRNTEKPAMIFPFRKSHKTRQLGNMQLPGCKRVAAPAAWRDSTQRQFAIPPNDSSAGFGRQKGKRAESKRQIPKSLTHDIVSSQKSETSREIDQVRWVSATRLLTFMGYRPTGVWFFLSESCMYDRN